MVMKKESDILPKPESINRSTLNPINQTQVQNQVQAQTQFQNEHQHIVPAIEAEKPLPKRKSTTNTRNTAPKKKRKANINNNNDKSPNDDEFNDDDYDDDDENNNENNTNTNTNTTTVTTTNNSKNNTKQKSNSAAGHRPVTSCTHCRQHKIKCNASEQFPDPCSRCQRMGLKCEIDPQFRPKKGSQIQSLRNDVDELRSKIEFLTRNENLITKVLQNTPSQKILNNNNSPNNITSNNGNDEVNKNIIKDKSPSLIAKTLLQKEPVLLSLDARSNSTQLINDSAVHKTDLNAALNNVGIINNQSVQFDSNRISNSNKEINSSNNGNFPEQILSNNSVSNLTKLTTPVNTKSISQNNLLSNTQISEFILGEVKISFEKASTLHKRFIDNYLPYLPIMVSNDPIELYQQSQLLFWTVMLTACLSDPEPSLYNEFASLIKQLAIETCWIRTPRSTHIVQSLIILSIWPLPNQKVLDDSSYRFIGLAKSLSLQLGLHRGKFMTEFTRTQVTLSDAEKWRSRTWLAVFFCEQFWSSNLGLPPSLQTDYLIESARVDDSLPKNFRCLISLAIFQAKLVNIMGLNVSGPDGLMEPSNRAIPLNIMERELERLSFKLQIDDLVIEIYYLYVKLMLCLFAFLPDTPSEDQIKFITIAYHSATRIVTIISKLLENKQLTELPIYVRHSVTTASLILFRLHLTSYLTPKYIDSSRQSIVTVHRLFRNMLAAWKDVENDISRTATVLEKLNIVIITHPELFTETEGIIVRMRSHLTGSLFYDLVWNIHESRRRTIEEAKNNNTGNTNANDLNSKVKINKKIRKALPLPFYNQITKDDFTAITTTTPNGTTITTLVPTDQAIINAKVSAFKAGLSKPTEINGIPLYMLTSTGSLGNKAKQNANNNNNNNNNSNNNNVNTSTNTTTNIKVNKPTMKQTKVTTSRRKTISNYDTKGYVPPPLFATATSSSYNNKNKQNSSVQMSRAVSYDTSMNKGNEEIGKINNNNNMKNSITDNTIINDDVRFKNAFKNKENDFPLTTPLEKEENELTTPMSINGLDKFFQSPISEIDNNGTITKGKKRTPMSQSPADSDLLDEMFIDSLFQQNTSKIGEEDNDDLLGWFDMNMAPEF